MSLTYYPNIMKAKQKIEVVEIQTFGIDIKNRLDILELMNHLNESLEKGSRC